MEENLKKSTVVLNKYESGDFLDFNSPYVSVICSIFFEKHV